MLLPFDTPTTTFLTLASRLTRVAVLRDVSVTIYSLTSVLLDLNWTFVPSFLSLLIIRSLLYYHTLPNSLSFVRAAWVVPLCILYAAALRGQKDFDDSQSDLPHPARHTNDQATYTEDCSIPQGKPFVPTAADPLPAHTLSRWVGLTAAVVMQPSVIRWALYLDLQYAQR